MEESTIEVRRREETGKNANRRLRASGEIPAIVYGGGKESVAISVQRQTMHDLLRHGTSENAVFNLKLGGSDSSRHTMLRELDIDPVSREILHMDFQRVDLKKKVRVNVPVEVEGLPEGVKNEGGVLDFISREVEVECLPTDIPHELLVDVSALHIGQHIEAGDIPLPDDVELMTEPGRVIVSVAHSRVAQEVEELEAEGAEDALIEAEAAEPELIKRGKDEDEDEEADGDSSE